MTYNKRLALALLAIAIFLAIFGTTVAVATPTAASISQVVLIHHQTPQDPPVPHLAHQEKYVAPVVRKRVHIYVRPAYIAPVVRHVYVAPVVNTRYVAPVLKRPTSMRTLVVRHTYTSNSSSSAKNYAAGLLSPSQFQCLSTLWDRESGWSTTAYNPSGAYGIPQAMPGSKMAAFGSAWRTDYRVQIAWGLDYIRSKYGTPCSALGHSNQAGWY